MATDRTGTGAGWRPGRSPRHITGAAGDPAMGTGTTTPSPALSRAQQLALRVAGAGLLAATAAIHLDLYLTGYRTIPVIGWLFLLQVIAGFGLAAALLASGSRVMAAAGAGFAAATLGGYLLSVWAGLFGFTEVRTTAGIAAGVIEVAAFAVLAVAAAVPAARPQAAEPARPRLPLARLQPSVPGAAAAAAGVSALALALLGAAAAQAGSPAPAAASRAAVVLKTATIGGATVLANAKGLTLYWFAPDTPGRSACYGSCAAYWPPVTGRPAAGPSVTGHLGIIKRSGGQLQATYNRHPLYAYVGDSAPGQARGNNLNLNGGLWHEVTVSG
jgi:predicted lipoprotein with Yx(FWY)xxD motif